MTGLTLKQAFHREAKGKKGEIALFRAFIKAFGALGSDALATEYHGNRYQVTFNAVRGAGRATPRCELCDVMIIQYPTGNANAARVTFNQAKVTDNALGCGRYGSTFGPDSFRANLEQWDLLSNRPHISPATTTFYPPMNLLSDAILPSIGTFGVFYPSGTTYDFAYFVACGLRPLNNNHSSAGTLQWLAHSHMINSSGGYDEITGTCCLETFGDALQDGLIGTPVWPLLYGAKGSAQMRIWLKEVLSSLKAENPDSLIPDELLSGLELQQMNDEFIPELRQMTPSLPRAVIVVKTERENPVKLERHR